jgi:hypothetical protein
MKKQTQRTQKKATSKKTTQKARKPKQVMPSEPASQVIPQTMPAPQAEILPSTEKSLAFSYLALRAAIGGLGFALPFAVSLGAWIIFGQGLQSSISAYYYTGTRDVLVGALFATGFFLFSYNGYARADNIASKLAFAFALGVALFPTTPTTGDITPTAQVIGTFHYIFAAGFFLTLSYFCLFLFVKTNASNYPPMTLRKEQRNIVYKICGGVMLTCIVLMAIYNFAGGDKTSLASLRPTYWLETLAILAFGVSWLTKGEAILKDES